MRAADDAEQIDTTDLTIDDVVSRIEALVRVEAAGVNRVDVVWKAGQLTIGSVVRAFVPLRVYGKERVPPEGGIVMAFNHFSLDRPAGRSGTPRRAPCASSRRSRPTACLGSGS